MGNTSDEDDESNEAAQCFGIYITDSVQDAEPEPAPQEMECEVWPEHWDALLLYLACRGQMEVALGGMGGVHCMPARSVNVHQELSWLALPECSHTTTVGLFRKIEHEAIRVINARSN